MKCCVNCFQDGHIIDMIKAQGETGKCDFCGAEEIETLEATELKDAFEQLFNLYEPAEAGSHYIVGDSANDPDFNYDGRSLAECIDQEDGWGIFSDKLSMSRQNDLLDEIRFGDLRHKEQLMEVPSGEWWASRGDNFFKDRDEDVWDNFAHHIKFRRRFLPNPDEFQSLANPTEWLPDLLKDIAADIAPDRIFFRARIGALSEGLSGPQPLPAKDMSAPPSEKATRGRANPAGISYLYVADEGNTAVAEIRPFVGAKITVATLRPKRKLCVVDLTKDYYVRTPFGHENLKEILMRNALLNTLNKELARPVNPDDSEVEYVPTQYLAEVVLNSGYDGIRYKSAITATGKNLVFFSPDDLAIDSVTKLVTIQSMQVKYE